MSHVETDDRTLDDAV